MLHRFRAGRGTGTAALDYKLLQYILAMREADLFEVFLDLPKAYDALDWDRLFVILAEYGVGPRTIQLLRTYWNRLTMVASAGGYFGLPFKGYRGITQGEPLSPTLFNVVVDAFICHWVTVVAPTADGLEGRELLLRELAEYLYADDGLAASTQPERLQRAFIVLTGLSNRVVLRTNTRKPVSMACHGMPAMSCAWPDVPGSV